MMGETGQAKDPLRTACAQFVKELIWRCLVRFRPSKRPICVYGSRRSGSSLLMQMIAANRGVMFSDQPFGIYTASSANINRLPLFSYGQIACPDATEEAVLRTYAHDLLQGRIRANTPWKFWGGDFHFWNDRICLKITDAKAMADWMDQEFGVLTVVLTRHPVAQALSVSRNGWLTTGKGFLRNVRFVKRWLDEDLVASCERIYEHGTEFEQRIADWALENLPLIKMLPERQEWLFVSYEDLLTRTSSVVDYLGEKLQLEDREAMLAQVKSPSRSTRRESTVETRQLIVDQDRARLANSWQQHVTDHQLQRAFELLDQFRIALYRPDHSLPDHRWLGREGFA